MALEAEAGQDLLRARARVTKDPATRALAREMAEEEADHIVVVQRALERLVSHIKPRPGA